MTPKELVEVVSETLGIHNGSVVLHDRNLLVAGLRTEAMRGRGKSFITSQDAARLIVAATASRTVRASADTIKKHATSVKEVRALLDGVGNATDRLVIISERISETVSVDTKISVDAIRSIASKMRGE